MDKKFMKRALSLAKRAAELGEVPVGCVIVKDGEIIAEAYNLRETENNALSHAETEAVFSACKKLNSWRLDGCSLYCTLEPCVMCTGAIINARISEVVFGAYDPQFGCVDSKINLFSLLDKRGVKVYGGICEDDCKALLDGFFHNLRNR